MFTSLFLSFLQPFITSFFLFPSFSLTSVLLFKSSDLFYFLSSLLLRFFHPSFIIFHFISCDSFLLLPFLHLLFWFLLSFVFLCFLPLLHLLPLFPRVHQIFNFLLPLCPVSLLLPVFLSSLLLCPVFLLLPASSILFITFSFPFLSFLLTLPLSSHLLPVFSSFTT